MFYFAISPHDWINLKKYNLHILYSFPYFRKTKIRPSSPCIIDSGAYSVYNSGLDLSIEDYAQFLRDEKEKKAFNFDSIGNADETYENQKYLEDQGLSVIPCFHMGSKYTYLYQYIDEGYDYIAIGGLANSSVKVKDKFIKKCFKIGQDFRIKFHGFGVTFNQCSYFPFYSIDSTSWKMELVYGYFYRYRSRIRLSPHFKGWLHPHISAYQALHMDYMYKKTVKENMLLYYSYFRNKKIIEEILS